MACFSCCHSRLHGRDCSLAARPAPSRASRSRSLRGLVLLLRQRLALDLELHDAALHLVDLGRHASRSRCAAGWPPRPSGRSPCRAGSGRRCSGATAWPRRRAPRPGCARRGGPRSAPSGRAGSRSCPRTSGSPTKTGWKRRSSAASFSMCFRYSLSVVAPMQRSSPRASAGFSMLAASIAPSAAPAPTSVCSSSMNRMTSPCDSSISLSTAFRRSSNSPRYLAPAISAPRSSATTRLVLQRLGHVAGDDALRQPLDDGGLADAGLADQHRVVLGAARQHLHHAADLLVAADHRVELALAGQLGQVARVALERLVAVLGVRIGRRAGCRGSRAAPSSTRLAGRRPCRFRISPRRRLAVERAPAAGARWRRTRP